MNLSAGLEGRHRYREWSWTQEKGENEMNCEIRTNIYVQSCVRQIASGSLLGSTGSAGVLCDDHMGGRGVRWEEAGGGDKCMHVADSVHCTGETAHSIVKQYPDKQLTIKTVNKV